MSATLSDSQKKQMEQAEELLFDGPEKEGFAKDLYFGRFRTESIMPYPDSRTTRVRQAIRWLKKQKSFAKSISILMQ